MQRVIGFVAFVFLLIQPSFIFGADTDRSAIKLSGYGTISFKGVPPEKRIEIDGQDYGQAGLLGPISVPAGEHVFRLGSGAVPLRLLIPSSQTTYIVNHLSMTTQSGPSGSTLNQIVHYYSEPTRERTGLLLTGAGTLSMVVGLVFGYSAIGVASESEGLKRDEVLRSEYDAIVETAQQQVLAANAFLITGGVMLVSGLSTLYLDGYFDDGERR